MMAPGPPDPAVLIISSAGALVFLTVPSILGARAYIQQKPEEKAY